MKIVQISALTLLATGGAYAQGIFNISPNEDAKESLPLEYTANVNLGWDDNVTPGLGNEEDASYGSLGLGANFVHVSPQTILDLNAYVGATHYFDTITSPGADDNYYQGRLALNLNQHINPRVRFSSRNFVNYGLEPDYTYGFANDRTLEEHLFLSTDNAIGYQWSDRVGTYTGIRYTTLNYDSAASSNDRDALAFYNQFRYVASPQDVYTLDYSYSAADNSLAPDADTQSLLVGLERRLTDTSTFVGRVGVSRRDIDGGDDSYNPSVEVSYSNSVNEQFKFRTFARYGFEEYSTSVGNALFFDENSTLRISVAGDYNISHRLIFTAGVNYLHSEYSGGNYGSDEDLNLFNAHVGLTMKLNDNASANLTYNLTTSSSDIATRDYDRNRVQLGLSYTF